MKIKFQAFTVLREKSKESVIYLHYKDREKLFQILIESISNYNFIGLKLFFSHYVSFNAGKSYDILTSGIDKLCLTFEILSNI